MNAGDSTSVSLGQPVRPAVASWLLPAAFFMAVAMLAVFLPIFASERDVPGDLGDARFNMFVLEHLHRWLTGREASLLSPGIFYPWPYTFAFSDMHLGSGLAYSALRLVGLNEYDALKGWIVVGYMLTFLAACHVLVRLSVPPWFAALGAFGFAFSLPALVQVGHPQMIWRVGVPFAFLHAIAYARTKEPRQLFALVAWLAFQTLTNIYTGLHALLICAIAFVVTLAFEDRLLRTDPRVTIGNFLGPLLRLRNYVVPSFPVAVVLSGAMIAMFAVYVHVTLLYGFGRVWESIRDMVPRPWSWVLLDILPYWEPVSRALPVTPMRHEHQIFLGVAPTLAFVAAIVLLLARPAFRPGNFRIFATTSLITILLVTMFGPFTLYWFIEKIPGFNALRAVARIQLTLAFPIMATVAIMAANLPARRWRVIAGAVLALWMTADLAMLQVRTFAADGSRARVDGLTAKMRASPIGDDSVLAYGGDQNTATWLRPIDAMLASQQLGIATVNGYSGNSVPGHAPRATCETLTRQLALYDAWAGQRGFPPLAALPLEPLTVELGDCDLSKATLAALPLTGGPPPSPEAARGIAVTAVEVRREGDELVALATIRNGSPVTVHALAKNPLRLSWRFPRDGQALPLGWDTRLDLGADLAPGQSATLKIRVSAAGRPPGSLMQVTFVVEHRFWAHDIGIAPFTLVLP